MVNNNNDDNKKKEKPKQVMCNAFGHHPLTNARPPPPQTLILHPCGNSSSLYTGVVFHGGGCPFGQFRPHVPAMLPPSLVSLHIFSLAEHGMRKKK